MKRRHLRLPILRRLELGTEDRLRLQEMGEITRVPRKITLNATPISNRDLTTPDQPDTSVTDWAELDDRADILYQHLHDMKWALEQLLEVPPLIGDAYRQILTESFHFGVIGNKNRRRIILPQYPANLRKFKRMTPRTSPWRSWWSANA